MEEAKKRRLVAEAGDRFDEDDGGAVSSLRLLLDPLRKDQLVDLVLKLATKHPVVAEEIKDFAVADPVHRKLFVRGLSWDTTSDTLCAVFSVHGEIEEGAVIADKATGKSRGYGFVTYKNIESAHRALQEPSKLIDGRLTVCNLACEGLTSASVQGDVALRKIYIGGLSPDISTETLLNFFGRHGEIEEGSVAYDKETNRSRGFGFVTYKSPDAARKAIDDSNKILRGRNITVKYAESHKKAMQSQLMTTVPLGYAQFAQSMAAYSSAMSNAAPQYQQALNPYAHTREELAKFAGVYPFYS